MNQDTGLNHSAGLGGGSIADWDKGLDTMVVPRAQRLSEQHVYVRPDHSEHVGAQRSRKREEARHLGTGQRRSICKHIHRNAPRQAS